MVTIRLIGEAGRRFGRQFKLAVKTPAEAVRALCVQIPGLRQYLLDSEQNGIGWRAITEHPNGLDEEGLLWPMSKRFVLAPIPAGKGGVGKIIAGVALVAVSILFAPAGAFAGGLFTLGAQAVPIVAGIGLSLAFSGIADLLTPTPKMPNVAGPGGIGSGATSGRSREEQERSFTFDKSNANTQQGDVVPVLYGERIIGSLPVLSFGLELQNSL
jgi:predicted phage tail protein